LDKSVDFGPQSESNSATYKKSFKTYRSFKIFSAKNFVNDLMKSDLDKITEIEDVDEAYNKFEEVMVNTINEHAPMKKRKSLRTYFYTLGPWSFLLRRIPDKNNRCAFTRGSRGEVMIL
jgi:deoxyhypusine synthase